MSSSFRVPPVSLSEDQIDLFALFQAVWHQKVRIVLIATGFGLVAAAYAYVATPEYHVSSVLRPAAINELDALNRSDIYKLPPSAALTKVGASLESYDTRLGYFRENRQLFEAFERPGRTLEQSFEEFNADSIKLTLPDSKKADSLSAYIKLSMDYPKGVDGVAILNGLVDYAIKNERQQIANDMEVIVDNRLNELEGKLDAARASYDNDKEAKIATLTEADSVRRAQLRDEIKALRVQLKTRRINRVAQLDEAIGIARSLGIRKPATPSSFGEASREGGSSVMRTEINNQQIPLYFMGVDALMAERAVLLQRKSDDFTEGRIAQIFKELQLLETNRKIEVLNSRENEDIFLRDVEPLRAEAARLRNLNLDISRIKLVTIDRLALEPLGPVKPRKLLIIAMGLLLGSLVGVAFAVFHYFISLRNAEDKAANSKKALADSSLRHDSPGQLDHLA
ncbi:Wzz/FepE/Etk N-terminal domain-containing protein [Pseudomonas sp. VB3]|uniref:Wzz/FepE/Etk N-terminal domain-containing protein n=1 Tax=Pseudomonas sp. VB3 TaxID=2994641 RepID=UPI0022EC9064|nr:Wzz/FepE/Etk N-terminal domain-containing protein [Pseudomonas sp. VB3]